MFDLFTALGLVSQNFRLSERADQDCADEEEHRANHNDVELQGNVHEGGSMAIYGEAILPEKRRSARGNPCCDAVKSREPVELFI